MTPSKIQLRATTPQPPGVYNGLVRLTITVPPEGDVVERDIPVTWRVVETLHQIYLPLAMRN